jgi:predicted acetyltransferase
MTARNPPAVAVTVARPAERDTLANLFQLYIHDFSEHWAGTARGELDGDGRFPDDPHLDSYWREPDRIPLLLRVEGHLVGFALLNAVAHSGRPVERSMAEFFVVRKHRRSGVGTVAAQTVFGRYPGRWEVAVARRNTGALEFWRTTITRHPLATEVEESDVVNDAWDGTIFRFRIENSAASS